MSNSLIFSNIRLEDKETPDYWNLVFPSVLSKKGKVIQPSLNKDNTIFHACKDCDTPFKMTLSSSESITCEGCGRTVEVAGNFRINHGLKAYGMWVPYLGQWRFKDRYDILLNTGEIILQTYPNGGSFAGMNCCELQPEVQERRWEDNEVLMVRLVPDEEIVEKYHFSGDERVDRNADYFGDAIPLDEDFKEINGTVYLMR